jgi:hypothetical protein
MPVYRNKFIVNGGSYGGIYVPNIATVIHEQNAAISLRKGAHGARHINLESLMISNPVSVRTSGPPLPYIRLLILMMQIGSAFLLPLVPPPGMLQHQLVQLDHLFRAVRRFARLSREYPICVRESFGGKLLDGFKHLRSNTKRRCTWHHAGER